MKVSINELRIKLLGLIFVFDALAFGIGTNPVIYTRLFLYTALLFLIPFKFKIAKNSTSFYVVLLGVLSLALSIVNSSNVSVSFDSGLKVFFSLIIYFIVFLSIRTEHDFLKLSKYSFYALFCCLVAVLLSNIFKFGEINYRDETIRFGASGVNFVKNIFLFGFLSIPYVLFSSKRKTRYLAYSMYFFSIVLIFLATKRSALLALVVAIIFLVYFNRRNLQSMIVPAVIAVIAGLFFFQDIIVERISNRADQFTVGSETDLDEEWRVIETNLALEKFEYAPISGKIFGEETFNEIEAYNMRYMFHNDFAVLITSTGLLGFSLFVVILVKLFLWFFKNSFVKFNFKNGQIYKWMFISMFVGLLLFGISGNFKSLGSSLSISLASLAAIQGFVIRMRVK